MGLADLAAFLRRGKTYVRRLPRPLYFLLIYTVLYFTTLREFAEALSFLHHVPESIIILLRQACVIIGVSHVSLITASSLIQRLSRKQHLWLGFEQLGISFIFALAIATVFTVPTVLRRGPIRILDDKERLAIADSVVGELEVLVTENLNRIFGEAEGRLQTLRQQLQAERNAGRDPVNFFRQYQMGRRAEPMSRYYGYLIVYVPVGSTSPHVPILAAPDFPTDEPMSLAKQAQGEARSWLTWTAVGHLAVAAERDEAIGTLVAASAWDEGSFLEATRKLWDDDGYGLTLIRKSEKEDWITYTTEISDYGERKSQEPAQRIQMGQIVEVAHPDRVEYVYQRPPRDRVLFPGLLLRVRFPERPKTSAGQILSAVAWLLGSLLVVAFLLFLEVVVDADNTTGS